MFETQKDAPAALVVDVRLDYSAVEDCPAENALRNVVAARMGYDPFTPPSRRQCP